MFYCFLFVWDYWGSIRFSGLKCGFVVVEGSAQWAITHTLLVSKQTGILGRSLEEKTTDIVPGA